MYACSEAPLPLSHPELPAGSPAPPTLTICSSPQHLHSCPFEDQSEEGSGEWLPRPLDPEPRLVCKALPDGRENPSPPLPASGLQESLGAGLVQVPAGGTDAVKRSLHGAPDQQHPWETVTDADPQAHPRPTWVFRRSPGVPMRLQFGNCGVSFSEPDLTCVSICSWCGLARAWAEGRG